MAENNIGTYTCKYIGFKDGIFLKGSGSSVISIKRMCFLLTCFFLTTSLFVMSITNKEVVRKKHLIFVNRNPNWSYTITDCFKWPSLLNLMNWLYLKPQRNSLDSPRIWQLQVSQKTRSHCSGKQDSGGTPILCTTSWSIVRRSRLGNPGMR